MVRKCDVLTQKIVKEPQEKINELDELLTTLDKLKLDASFAIERIRRHQGTKSDLKIVQIFVESTKKTSDGKVRSLKRHKKYG